MGSIPLYIRFNQRNGVFKTFDGIRYLVLFSNSWYDKICDRIKYLIIKNVVLQVVLTINFGRIRIDSCNSLPIEKMLTFHNVTILIKSVVNENKNNFYDNIFS